MRIENLALSVIFALALVVGAHAGTGGSELTSMWNEISSGLQGFWGKIIAVLFVGLALAAAKGGNILMAFAMFIIGMLIGTIPSLIDARYSLTFFGF